MVVFKMNVSNVFQKLVFSLEAIIAFVTPVLFDGFCKIVNKQLSDKNEVKN